MKPLYALTFLSLLLSPAVVKADIDSVTGQATVVSAPASATTGTGAFGLVFFERTTVLGSPLAVEMSLPGHYASIASFTPGTIAAGTSIDTYYYHSLGPDTSGDIFSGSITFSEAILGVDGLAKDLIATNFLGSPTTTYATTDQGQSFEFGTQIDSVTISADRHTLTFLNETFGAADDLRIFTATPEPNGLLLLSTVLAAIFASAKINSRLRSGK